MKGNNFRKLICCVLSVIMILSLAACGDTTTPTDVDSSVSSESNDTEGLDTVVAVINGKNVTRSEVGQELIDAEKEVISNYVYNTLVKEFFKDVTITDSEVELQMQMLKSQVGEDSWPMYLAYYGGGTEETFKEMLKDSMRQEQYVSKKMETLSVDDAILEEAYAADPNAHNIAVLDVIFFDNYEDLTEAKGMQEGGMTLEEISESMEMDIFPDEHTYYYSEGLTWNANIAECEVGDYIYSNEDSGSLVIARIKELNEGLENKKVKEDLLNSLKYDEAYVIVNEEYSEFLKSQSVQIFGEDYPLYEDTETSTEISTETSAETSTETSVEHDHDGDGVPDHE